MSATTVADLSEDLQQKIEHWEASEATTLSAIEPTPLRPHIMDSIDAADGGLKRERWPVVRSGEREPINFAVRRAVAQRDNFTCRKCHSSIEEHTLFQIDHIIPWSAGGSDRSDNLRFLCERCNQDRSNYIDGTEARTPTRVTWWCVECWSEETHWDRREYALRVAGTYVDLTCRTRYVSEGHVIAYCANCRHLSRTDMTL